MDYSWTHIIKKTDLLLHTNYKRPYAFEVLIAFSLAAAAQHNAGAEVGWHQGE